MARGGENREEVSCWERSRDGLSSRKRAGLVPGRGWGKGWGLLGTTAPSSLGESAVAGLLLEDLGGGGGGGPPLGDMPSSLVSFRAILGSLNAALGGGAFSSLGGRPSPSFRAASLAPRACSRSGSLEVPRLSESLRGRSRCSLVALWALQALLLSLLASCKAGQEGDTVTQHLRAALLRLPRLLQGIIHLIQAQLEKIFHKALKK